MSGKDIFIYPSGWRQAGKPIVVSWTNSLRRVAQYDWINRIIAIGTGHRLPDGPIYSIFEILSFPVLFISFGKPSGLPTYLDRFRLWKL